QLNKFANQVNSIKQGDTKTFPPMLKVSSNQPQPLSHAQQRLWFLDQWQPGNTAYNLPTLFRLSGKLDKTALEQAMHEIVKRHEALRTCFGKHQDDIVQVIQDHDDFKIKSIDLTTLTDAEKNQQSQALINAEMTMVFELEHGPLFHCKLVSLSDQESLLLINMHHIISDGVSIGLLMHELSVLYEAFIHDQTSPLNPLSIQYKDFSAWQNQWLQGEIFNHLLNYWKQKLDGVEPIPLLSDKPRPTIQSFNGAFYGLSLSTTQIDELKQLSYQQGATLYMVLLTAFKTLLNRYSQHNDICVGSPIAGRSHYNTDQLIGFFINMQALRTDFSGEPTFIEALKRVKQTALEAYSHQDMPFEKLVDALNLGRDTSRSPVFQIAFSMLQLPKTSYNLTDIEIKPVEAEIKSSKFDITLSLMETEQGIIGGFEYNTDLFESTTIARLAEHYNRLIDQIIQQPTLQISRYNYLTEQEWKQLIDDQQPKQNYQVKHCLHQQFSLQAQQNPNAIAVVFENKQLSYQQLEQQSNQLAHYLLVQGVENQQLIGLSLPRSEKLIVGLLAILKAGGCYVPLDPNYPEERLSFVINDAKLKFVISQSDVWKFSLPENSQLIRLDTDNEVIQQQPDTPPDVTVTPDNLAYIIYTSGSTGTPKGVMVQHHQVQRLFLACQTQFHFDETDHWSLFHSYAFDFSVWEIWGALLHGGRLVVVPYWVSRSPEDFAILLTEEKITVLNQTPSAFNALIPLTEMQAAVKHLKTIVFGGESLDYQALIPWFSQHGDTSPKLVNMYGITETTIHVTHRLLTQHDCEYQADKVKHSLIGQPLTDLQLYILDQNLQPVPVGVSGEIHVGGAGVTQGYLNQNELTAQKFIDNPFNDSQQKLYKTGDLARRLNNDDIAFLGRLDHQVKIRGFRIELGEIETHLNQHLLINSSQVIYHKKSLQLVAYLVAANDAILSRADIKTYLQNCLPDYMVPQVYIKLDLWPLTANGKIDFNALPEPQEQFTLNYVTPETGTEQQVSQLWCQLLGIEKAGLTDNFFELGGHSLLATQLSSRIKKQFNITLKLPVIFEAENLKVLAQRIDEQSQSSNTSANVIHNITKRPENTDIPLSFAQERLWFLDLFEPGSPIYNIPFALEFKGSLDHAQFEKTCQHIIERHEILRTIIVDHDDLPTQTVLTDVDFKLAYQCHEGIQYSDGELQDILTLAATESFDLKQWPLFKINLYQLAEKRHILLFNLHHIIADGWSLTLLMNEIASLYEANLKNENINHDKSTIQYGDFAYWQRHYLTPDVLASQLNYWKQKLANTTILELPFDFQQPSILTTNGNIYGFELSKTLSDSLSILARQSNATLYMVLMTAFKVLLSKYCNQTDIIVGSPSAGRHYAEIENVFGCFVNTIVIRSQLDNNPDFFTLLSTVKQNTLAAYENQDIPFEQILDAVTPNRELNHSPLFQVMFALHNQPLFQAGFDDLEMQLMPLQTQQAKFELSLDMVETSEGLRAVFEYNIDLFESATIVQMSQHFQHLLQEIVKKPNQKINHYSLLSDAEIKQICVEFNSPKQLAECNTQSVIAAFEHHAVTIPDQIAIISGEEELSFEELNQLSNQLAHYLLKTDGKTDQIIALCLNRSVEMIIGILAVLKSGNAYLPIDTNYPDERINYMLNDTKTSLLLTEKQYLDRFGAFKGDAFCLDCGWAQIGRLSTDNLNLPIDQQNKAYIIYTSGSTGQPKGVCVKHSNLTHFTDAAIDAYHLTQHDRLLQFSSISFDASIEEIFPALVLGAPLILRSDDMLDSARMFFRGIDAWEISTVSLPTAFWHELVSQLVESELEIPRCLRQIVIGGEAVYAAKLTEWQQTVGTSVRLLNSYGPTEATVVSTVFDLTNYQSRHNNLPIGQAIANVQTYVMDKSGNPVPFGVHGELYIGGSGITQGYLNKPDLTATSFVPDLFNPYSKDRLYKTGDKVRQLRNGIIEYLGRIDQQVKFRGYRIELGEIESVIIKQPDVSGCAVILWSDSAGRQRLIAYVVTELETQQISKNLKAGLKKSLPDYMIPSFTIKLDQLPIGANGKLDKNLLPEPVINFSNTPDKVNPRNSTEVTLAEIWSDVLGLEQCWAHDNFFDLGGHSLLATQIISRVRRIFRIEVPLKVLFEYPTIAGFARHLEHFSENEADIDVNTIIISEHVDNESPLLSHAQERLWFLQQLSPDSAAYNMPMSLRIEGSLNRSALKESITEIVRRHEPLRTSIVSRQGKPVQIIRPVAKVDDSFIIFTEASKSLLDELIAEDAIWPFDLTEGEQLFRVTLIKLAD
ncbi:MAG: amino acid adenylation domain-containing protein, partial [Methylococcales bacterium]|nr:amino acid adenylation domain-containing protein [Methylococcales bacterium]